MTTREHVLKMLEDGEYVDLCMEEEHVTIGHKKATGSDSVAMCIIEDGICVATQTSNMEKIDFALIILGTKGSISFVTIITDEGIKRELDKELEKSK